MAPKLIALNKLGELRNKDATLYEIIQEMQGRVNEYILDQAGAAEVDALSTTGAAVNVAAAAPPTVGQALVATDATHATWQAVAASGGLLFAQTADSTTTANSATTLFGTGVGTLTLPANFLVAGRTIRVTMGGYASTGASNAVHWLLISLGGVTVATGGFAFGSSNNWGWQATATITCRTTGSSGTVVSGGDFMVNFELPVVASGVGTATVDTTGTLAIDMTLNNGSVTGAYRTQYAVVEALS